MLETSNALQREPQQADLNVRRKLISRPPRPVFIFCMGVCGLISRQSALIARHNAFNFNRKLEMKKHTVQNLVDVTCMLQLKLLHACLPGTQTCECNNHVWHMLRQHTCCSKGKMHVVCMLK